MKLHSIQREVSTVYDPLTSVIDRVDRRYHPHKNKRSHVWFAVIACVATLALIVSAVLTVHFYLSLQDQRKLAAQQTEQLVSLQQAFSKQAEQLSSQESAIASQQAQISKQESDIAAQQSTIEEQKDTISSQQEVIKKKTTVKQTVTTKTTSKKAVKGVAVYPDIDTSALKGKKLVALTFDDGPSQYTATLLDALKRYNAKATFFVLGSRLNSDSSKALLKRMEDEGHVVGNHSQNHKNLRYLTKNGVENELYTASARIKQIIGHYPIVMRCPGGNYNNTVCSYAESINTPIIQWSLDTVDWRDRNKATVVSRVKKDVKDGSIVLMHDLYETTVNAAVTLIPYLQKQGYTLVTVPELLAAKRGEVEAGKVYFAG